MQQQQLGEARVTVGLPAGAARMSSRYCDANGRMRHSAVPVPVNDFGQIVAAGWRCPKCTEPRWVPIRRTKDGPVADGRVPVCPVHDRRMVPLRLRRAPVVPVREVWRASERKLRPVWALPAMAAAGAGLDVGQVPAAAVALAVPAGFEAARRIHRRYETSVQVQRGRLDGDDPQAHRRRRAAIDRAARKVGYTAAAGAGWLTLAAGAGVDPSTWAGRLVWSALLPVWALPAATWWWLDRNRETPRVVAEEAPGDDTPGVDPAEVEVRRIWDTVLAVQQGAVIGHDRDGKPVAAKRDGKLAGCRMLRWWRVEGGWAAACAGPIGAYESDTFIKAVGAIASAFSVKKSMVTVTPDPEDENLFEVMTQRVSPIRETPRWSGPTSIDVQCGTAPVMVYADGCQCLFELWRPGWGCPHVAAFGTTGSAKSSFLKLLFTIGRWAHVDGRGLVADFLIDPQQGQSFSEFLDDLAGPVACSLSEAMELAEALTEEGVRRNRFLAREAEWWDERRKKIRKGREWWNPLTDGPMLALSLDEAHDYLSHRPFATLITKAGRMWRKCGIQLRLSTHTPLLSDLGGNMALRDMLTGGFVWMGRTANSLSGPVAFNGRLPVDPRLIPAQPGMAYPLAGMSPKPMLARTMREPDWYDWLRDDNDEPIGFPASLPPETLATLGRVAWGGAARPVGAAVPEAAPERIAVSPPQAVDALMVEAVLDVLARAAGPVDMNGLDAGLRGQGVDATTLQVRSALRLLREQGLVFTGPDRRHELTPQAREDVDAQTAEMGGAFDGGAA